MTERKTRIQRRLPSELVLVDVLSEPLQDLWLRMTDAGDRYACALDEIRTAKKKPSEEKYKELNIAEGEAKILTEQFWLAVRHQYGLWGISLGVRDGFQVVEIPNDGVPPIIKAIIGG